MIKCPSCSHENVDGTIFCEMCGEELAAAPAAAGNGSTPAAADAAATSGDIKCPACENLNPRDNVVCEVCGTELHPAGSDTPAAAPVSTPAPTTDAAPPDTGTPSVAAAADNDPMNGGIPAAAPVSAPDPAVDTTSASPLDTVTVDGPVADTTTDAGTAADTSPAGAPAVAPSTPAAPDTPAVPGAALKPGMVKLVVEQGMSVGKQFVLGDPELLVGREDEEEDIYPDIDLADQDEGYVHRQHATLKFENDGLFVTHLGGANKSRLNNKPIPDNQPQPVKLGDKIAFGKVVLRVLPL